jgi:hypothetical protein
VGIVATIGALYVGQLGGAFEANKLLTGLFAIPVAIPLVCGILFKRPNAIGALATVLIGILAGFLLNGHSQISWELATFIEIVICFAIFFSSGWWVPKTLEYKERVDRFFKLINTPLRKDEIPVISTAFKKMLSNVFMIALALSGLLILTMALFSLGTKGSNIAITGSILYFLVALVIFFVGKRPLPTGKP